MMNWSTQDSEQLYGLQKWGQPFLKVNSTGNIVVTSNAKEPEAPQVDLYKLTLDLKERGLRLPVLIRFTDILKERIESISSCFQSAIKESEYQAKYLGVYPVKVNQEKHLVEDLVKLGKNSSLGLECGSKPELLIALAKMTHPEGLIICNGFKDRDYIETALLSRKLGRNTLIVVDRYSELDDIIKLSKAHDVEPSIGFRVKLSTQAAGKWAESSGHKSKFGLSPQQIVQACSRLKEHQLLDKLDLLHFHVGSQVPSIQNIKSALKEGARFYAELYGLGARPSKIDVGGGLGVDYDGTGSSDSSVNYSDQEYANDVVYTIKSICEEKDVPHPDIVTESGRALVAHSSLLVFDILGSSETQSPKKVPAISPKAPQVLRDLNDIQKYLSPKTITESFHDIKQIERDVLQLFTYGVLNLEQRSTAEEIINNLYIEMRKLILQNKNEDFKELLYEVDTILCETYFCNFSIFQSLPDSWAMEQLFPIIPIHRLNECPERRAVLVDLTCDSDGTIDKFIDPTNEEPQNFIEVHSLKKQEPYYMAVFLTGAYQEILGDMHNLFGDTDAVHVEFSKNRIGNYKVLDFVKGDSIKDVLKYVSYEEEELLNKLRRDSEDAISNGDISAQQARLLMNKFENSLQGYTYLRSE